MNAEPKPQAFYRVLLIEDHPGLGDVTAEMLRLKGQEVVLARTGREGIALAERISPDIVVCDLNLPDIPGREVAHRLRAAPDSHAVLVGLSAYGLEVVKQEAGDDFDLYLSKPLDWGKLESHMPRRPRRRNPPATTAG